MRSLLTLLAPCLAACAPGRAAAPGPPTPVVLVVLDSVRADRLGAYGGRLPTPRFDALAREGVLFERAYAGSSAAGQSLATLWTGRLPTRGGHTGLAEAAPHPELETLPRLFRRAGYRTALVSNHPGLRARTFTRGFDDVEVDSEPGRWSGAQVVERSRELLVPVPGADDGRPLFLVVVLADASEPYLPPARLRERIDVPPCEPPLTLAELRQHAGALPEGIERTNGFLDLVARYEAEVLAVDEYLGALVDALAGRGALDETLLVVTGSHGTELLEHGWVGHGWTLHEEVLHVPLLVRLPSLIAPARWAGAVSLADLVPSLPHLAGIPGARQSCDGAALFERAGERLVPRAGRAPVIAELAVPELVVARAAIQGERQLVEVFLGCAPAERLARLARLDARLAAVQRGEAAPAASAGGPLWRELLEPGRPPLVDPAAQLDAGELSALLERYAESCRGDGLAPVSARLAAEDDGQSVDLSELRQLGYL